MSELTRFDASRPLSLREAMDRFFEEGFLRPWLAEWAAAGSFAVDMYETEEAFVVKTVAAGMKPEDIEITLTNNVLTIRGHLEEEEKVEKERYHRMERRYGRFERSIALPTRVDAEKIEASLKDGILTIQVPKAEEFKPKKISVSIK